MRRYLLVISPIIVIYTLIGKLNYEAHAKWVPPCKGYWVAAYITGYTLSPDETDQRFWEGAFQKAPRLGSVANNCLKENAIVYIRTKPFFVGDHMNTKKYSTPKNRTGQCSIKATWYFDVLCSSKAEAFGEYGRRKKRELVWVCE